MVDLLNQPGGVDDLERTDDIGTSDSDFNELPPGVFYGDLRPFGGDLRENLA